MLKLCKDCKYCVITGSGVFYARCVNPKLAETTETNPVDGSMERKYCAAARVYSCGPDAKLFEPSAAYAEYQRDQKIDAARERSEDRAAEHADFDFERDCGARP